MIKKFAICSRCGAVLLFKAIPTKEPLPSKLCFRCPIDNGLVCLPTNGRFRYEFMKLIKAPQEIPVYSSYYWRLKHKPPRKFKLPYPQADYEG